MLVPILMSVLLQSIPTADTPFTDKERIVYGQTTSFDDRMRFFDDVVGRYRKDFEAYRQRKDFDSFVRSLDGYSQVLRLVDDDVRQLPEENKRKSKPLRRLEIQLRRAKDDLENFKRSAMLDQQAVFDQCIEQTESVRTTILQFIFGKGLLREK